MHFPHNGYEPSFVVLRWLVFELLSFSLRRIKIIIRIIITRNQNLPRGQSSRSAWEGQRKLVPDSQVTCNLIRLKVASIGSKCYQCKILKPCANFFSRYKAKQVEM